MKRFYLFLALMAMVSMVNAQAFTVTPSMSESGNLIVDTDVDVWIQFNNQSGADFDLGYELTTNNLHPGWEIKVCDADQCYFEAHLSDTMGPIRDGQFGFLKITAKAGSNEWVDGSISYDVWVVGDRENTEVEVTANFYATVDIDDAQLGNLVNIYPNPVQTELTFSATNGKLPKGTARIFDLKGTLLQTTTVNALETQTMDVAALPTGLYMVKYEANNEVVTKKFFKTN
ncbi:MAG: T9SS type A sorting domain-containing protein [Bacteroidota bacterium]